MLFKKSNWHPEGTGNSRSFYSLGGWEYIVQSVGSKLPSIFLLEENEGTWEKWTHSSKHLYKALSCDISKITSSPGQNIKLEQKLNIFAKLPFLGAKQKQKQLPKMWRMEEKPIHK